MAERRTKSTGSLSQRSAGVWRLRVYLGRDPRTGNPRQHQETFRGTETAAKKRLARLVTEAEDGKFDRTRVTLGELLDRWLDHIEPERSPTTIQDYRSAIEHAIRPALGSTKLTAVRTDVLDAWYRHWLAETVRPGRRRSPTTVRKYHAILSGALRQAQKWGWIVVNPAELATPPSARVPDGRAPSVEDLGRMIDACSESDPTLCTAIALAAATGMRRGELCALRWSDVGPASVVVARSISVVKREVHEGPTKTHAIRTIALDDFAQGVLATRRRYAEELAAKAGTTMAANAFVLSLRADGARPILPDTLGHRFGDLAAELGLRYHFHQLRHFSATVMLAAGIDPRTAAGRLGHANPSTTMRIYAHVLEAQDQRAAEALGRVLSAPVPTAAIEGAKAPEGVCGYSRPDPSVATRRGAP